MLCVCVCVCVCVFMCGWVWVGGWANVCMCVGGVSWCAACCVLCYVVETRLLVCSMMQGVLQCLRVILVANYEAEHIAQFAC